MNNILSDATVCDLFGEARFPALIMYCLEWGEAKAAERNRERKREQVQTGLANIIIFQFPLDKQQSKSSHLEL